MRLVVKEGGVNINFSSRQTLFDKNIELFIAFADKK